MNAIGQMMITAAAPDRENEDRKLRDLQELAGIASISAVTGLIEMPFDDDGLPSEFVYLYNVSGPRIATPLRLMMRSEEALQNGSTLDRLLERTESALSLSLHLYPAGRKASRKGWALFFFRGHIAQPETPTFFPGTFYEVLMDRHADTCAFFSTSDPRHFGKNDLATASVEDIEREHIWGFEELPFGKREDT